MIAFPIVPWLVVPLDPGDLLVTKLSGHPAEGLFWIPLCPPARFYGSWFVLPIAAVCVTPFLARRKSRTPDGFLKEDRR